MKKHLWLCSVVAGLVFASTSFYLFLQDSTCPPVNRAVEIPLEWLGLGLIGAGILLAALGFPKRPNRKRVIIAAVVAIVSIGVLAFAYSFAGQWLMPNGIFQCFNLY